MSQHYLSPPTAFTWRRIVPQFPTMTSLCVWGFAAVLAGCSAHGLDENPAPTAKPSSSNQLYTYSLVATNVLEVAAPEAQTDNTYWIDSTPLSTGGHAVKQRTPAGVVSTLPSLPNGEGAIHIASGMSGTVWVVSNTSSIYRKLTSSSLWEHIDGSAVAIDAVGFGSNFSGGVYIIGQPDGTGFRGIYRYENNSFVQITQTVFPTTVSGDQYGGVVVITNLDNSPSGYRVARYDELGPSWTTYANGAIDFAGYAGTYARLNSRKIPSAQGYSLSVIQGQPWSPLSAWTAENIDGVQVDVGYEGHPWVVNAQGQLFVGL